MEMETEIQAALSTVEKECGIRILYACESGSRAWGFASPDSDYDVRFLHAHPRDWYLSVLERDETIERMLPKDLDLSGWDLRKALRLFRNNNGALLEWLHSPIVYQEDTETMAAWRGLTPKIFCRVKVAAHYAGMTRRCLNDLSKKRTAKKYLYALRAVFCSEWALDQSSVPPVVFSDLCEGISMEAALSDALEALLERKAVTGEKVESAAIPEIDAALETRLERTSERLDGLTKTLEDVEVVDAFFRDVLTETS